MAAGSGMEMKSEKKRWELAQQYEKTWWESRKGKVDFGFYDNFAVELVNFIGNYTVIGQETAILEVGSGAGGIVTYLKQSDQRYGVDPLEDFYATVDEFRRQRDPAVTYQAAMGETLPFEDGKFDLIIIDNVLDHCDDPPQVMRELKRSLKPGGLIYFKQNTYHFWGVFFRALMEKLLIDKGHPHTFSKRALRGLIAGQGFTIAKAARDGYWPTWWAELRAGTVKDLIKALTLVTRDKVTYLLQ
jgi:SAM-dependent methyltransferase